MSDDLKDQQTGISIRFIRQFNAEDEREQSLLRGLAELRMWNMIPHLHDYRARWQPDRDCYHAICEHCGDDQGEVKIPTGWNVIEGEHHA